MWKPSFQSLEKVNKVNSGAAHHIPNKTRALYIAQRSHYQVKELLQCLQMWMESWGAVNKTAPQVVAGALWMGWQSQQRQSELIRDKRSANKLLCCGDRLTALSTREQLSRRTFTCDLYSGVITLHTKFTQITVNSVYTVNSSMTFRHTCENKAAALLDIIVLYHCPSSFDRIYFYLHI